MREAVAADRDEIATKAGLAGLRADVFRTLRMQGAGIVAIVCGFIAMASALELL